MAFAILRTKKILSTSIRKAQEHNLRIRYAKNVDKTRSHLNEILIDTFDIKNNKNLEQAINGYYEEKKVSRRENSVPLMEFVLTASPQFFENADKETLDEWKKHQLAFAKKKWGDSVKFAILHMDEKSPHFHIMVSTEHKTTKKYKNQFGEFHKESWSLNVKRFNRVYLRELQTEFAEHNKAFDLKRGMYNSTATHRTLKKYFSDIEEAKNTDYTEKIMSYFSNLKEGFFGMVSVKSVINTVFPMIESIVKQNKTYKTFLLNYDKNVGIFNKQFEENQKLKAELEEEKKELEARREVYKEVINGKAFDINTVERLKKRNEQLEKEKEELRLKYEPRPKVDPKTTATKKPIL